MSYSPILIAHIFAGTFGLLSGTAAMSFRKGSPRHVLAGKIFVASMLIMGVLAVYLAIVRHQPNNIGGGILTVYLIGTGWLTARRRDGETSRFDWAVLLIPLTLGILTWMTGLKVVRSGASSQDGVPVGMTFFMGSVMLLAGAGDVRMLVRGGVFGTKRIARHLWRMCFGLFIAAGSFFLGPSNRPLRDFRRGRASGGRNQGVPEASDVPASAGDAGDGGCGTDPVRSVRALPEQAR